MLADLSAKLITAGAELQPRVGPRRRARARGRSAEQSLVVLAKACCEIAFMLVLLLVLETLA
jgi:hypothetical protein